jgi:DNA-directed RNA polymerase specialized sigma subunit
VVEVTTYHANVERDGKFWAIHVPEVDRWTQARTVAEIEDMARDLVAIMDDVEPCSFDLDVTITLPPTVEKHLRRAEELERESHRARSEAARESRRAVRALVTDAGLSQSEVARVLHVSKQRVSQLANS